MAVTYASPTLNDDWSPQAAAAPRSGPLAASQVQAGSSPGSRIRPSRVPVTPVARGLQRCGDHPCSGGCDGHGHKLQPSALPGRRAGAGRLGEAGDVDGVAEVLRASGTPLDPGARTAAETYFGRSFSDVRVHTDARAAATSESVGARAYTVGNHLVFGPGQYAPHTGGGAGLLFHELTHVVQQSGSATSSASLPISRPEDRSEVEADRIGAEVAVGVTTDPASVRERSGPHVARDEKEDESL